MVFEFARVPRMHSFIRPNYERPAPSAASGTSARAIRVLAIRAPRVFG